MTNEKILVVDDDVDIALSTRLCLESAGYQVTEARNSEEGLKAIQQQRPDLIIMDVMMDSTTEGFQMALTLRNPDPKSAFKGYESIPIVMQTSIHSTTPVRFEPDRDYLPVDRFLDKPVEPRLLLQVVDELLHKS